MEKIIDTFNNFFSINNFIVEPKFPIKNAIKKNLDPLVNKEIKIKYAKLKCINPLLMVKSLKGTGENPAIASKVIQAITPPSEETLFFQNDGSTPQNSKIFIPISLKKTYPIKYPKQAPRTDDIVAIKAILIHSCLFAIVIGIIKTSGGIGNMKLSINEKKLKKNFDFLWPANLIDFK